MKYSKPTLISFQPNNSSSGSCLNGSNASGETLPPYDCGDGSGVVGGFICSNGQGNDRAYHGCFTTGSVYQSSGVCSSGSDTKANCANGISITE